MNIFNKLFGAFLICLCCFLFACENSSDINAVSFSNYSSAANGDFSVKITAKQDERIENKSFDIQIKSNMPATLKINKENCKPVEIEFEEEEIFKSLTSMIATAKNQSNTETFALYKDISQQIYLLQSEENLKLTFRAVVGDSVRNSFDTGYILANSFDISKEFCVLIEKK